MEILKKQAREAFELLDYSTARRLCEQVCRLEPGDAQNWLLLGRIDAETGQPADAIRHLETALDRDPDLAEACRTLAGIFLQQGRPDEAKGFLRRSLEIDPGHSASWLELGLLHAETGSEQEARRCFQEAVAPSSRPGTIWVTIALRLRGPATTSLAIEACGEALRHQPDSPALLRRLAGLQLDSGNFPGALQACRSLLERKPSDARAWSIAGTALQRQGNLVEAKHCLGRSLELEPDNYGFCYQYACIEQALGDPEAALACFRKAYDSGRGLPAALGGLARACLQLDRDDELEELLPPLLNTGHREPLVLPTLAYLAPRFGLTTTVIRLLQEALAKEELAGSIRARLYTALGALYESTGDYDAAFEKHTRAKELVPPAYNAITYTDYITRIIRCFDAGFLQQAPRASNCSELPVFIVGMPRSGTSLVEQILASHRDAHGAGEIADLGQLVEVIAGRIATGRRYPEYCTDLSTELMDMAAEKYLSKLGTLSTTALRITDKMPHNFQHLGLITLLLPKAHIIHVSRDPLDTCISCYFQEFSTAHAYTRSLQDLAHHYREYRRLMRHWMSIPGIRLLNVRYENLVNHPETVIRELVAFCGLEWDDNCLNFHASRRTVSTLSAEQVRQPLYRSSIGRWRHYERHLRILQQQLE